MRDYIPGAGLRDNGPMMLIGETLFVTLKLVIGFLAEGRRIHPALSFKGPDTRFELQCTICGDAYREHLVETKEAFSITRNGCRCCAQTKVVPVSLKHALIEHVKFCEVE